MESLNTLINRGVSRRKFLAGVGASAGAAAALNLAGCGGSSHAAPPTTATTTYTDADILNFALNLEYLEAQFYLYAATGSGLEASDTTAGSASPYKTVGTVTVGDAAAVSGLTPAQQEIVNEIAFEEQAHVRFLRSALGSAAVPMAQVRPRPRPQLHPTRIPTFLTSPSISSISRRTSTIWRHSARPSIRQTPHRRQPARR